jgi:hypothetical protein
VDEGCKAEAAIFSAEDEIQGGVKKDGGSKRGE